MFWGLLIPFLCITFALAWGALGVLILFPGASAAVFGEIRAANPLFMLAVYSPALAAFALVLRSGGPGALRAFLARLLLVRARVGWYLFIALGIPCLFLGGAWLKGIPADQYWPQMSAAELVGAALFMLLLGPMEEFGWRGFALPVLQRRLAPIWASLVLGAIWGIWHLPAFYLAGLPQSNWAFLPFFVGAIAVAVMATALFNASGGSLLLAILFHWQLVNPAFPDAAPYDTLFFVAAAAVLTILNWEHWLDSRRAITSVFPEPPAGTPRRRPAPAGLLGPG